MPDESILQEGAWEAYIQARLQNQLDIPALSNHAIVLCRKAMDRSARETMKELHLHFPGETPEPEDEENKLEPEEIRAGAIAGTKRAKNAYREAMPPLTGPANIRDFIACVAHGVLLDVISHEESSKLLYSAQVAISAEHKRVKSRFD
jgi:hypothetical protein